MFARSLLILSVALASSACGLTGATSRFTVQLAPPAGASAALALGSIALEGRKSNLVVVNAYAWGKYDQDDVEVLRDSLVESIEPFRGARPHVIHVRIRNVLVSTSNTEGFVVAAVTWVLVDPDGVVRVEEQFYATDSARMNNTLGGIKDNVHEAIAERVLATALSAASGAGDGPAPSFEHTYERYEDAIADLPSALHSVSMSVLFLGGGYQVWMRPGAPAPSGLELARADGRFDWVVELARR